VENRTLDAAKAAPFKATAKEQIPFGMTKPKSNGNNNKDNS
jgi:hypothetical protein